MRSPRAGRRRRTSFESRLTCRPFPSQTVESRGGPRRGIAVRAGSNARLRLLPEVPRMGLDAATTITWYGHACVEVRTPGGKTILIDPWFGNPKSPKAADAVTACDLLLVTHGHGDHMGDAVALASRLRPTWPCIHEMSLWLARRLPGGADHSAGDWNPGAETTLYLGEPAGFVIRLENGHTIYHAGDTNVFGDMAIIGELY